MFAVSVSVLFFYHLYLVLYNKTTLGKGYFVLDSTIFIHISILESFRAPVFQNGPDKNAYNLGARRNFEEVFGTRQLMWFCPVFTSLGDGHSFPLNPKYSDLENHFESTSTSDLTP